MMNLLSDFPISMISLFAFLIILAAMLVRSLTGFGSALISIPLLSLLFGAKYAIPFIMIYECIIDIMILAKDKGGLKRDTIRDWPMLAAALVGIPIGTEVLILSDDRLLKILIGSILIIFSILMLANLGLKLKRSTFSSATTGLVGGLLCGSVGMPGPPMALLLSSQGLEKEEFRRMMVIFLTAIDFLTFGYYILVGLVDAEMLIFSLWFIPAMLLGFLAGSLAFGRVSEERFRRLTLGITLAAGAFLLWSTWG